MHLKPAGYSPQYDGGVHFNRRIFNSSQFYFHYEKNSYPSSSSSSSIQQKASNEASTSNFDRIKSLERLVNDLVLESTTQQVSEEEEEELSHNEAKGEKPTALSKAREAEEVLESLRLLLLQEQRSTSSLGGVNDDQDFVETAPMTTAVNYFDLFVMVKSNLAAQLHNSGLFQDSLDLYMQLCKLASNNSGASLNGLLTGGASSSSGQFQQYQQHQQQHGGSRYMLYRFGLNIGNVLYDMADYQRALKYYRLTLDRLSSSSSWSSSGTKNLRLKLMSNIAVTLATLNQLAASNQISGKQTNRPIISGDTLTAFDLLLTDNLSTDGGMSDIGKSRPQRQESSTKGTQAASKMIYNANHYKFALNLMVCHYLRSDFRAMLGLLKDLVQLDICHQYRRMVELGEQQPVASQDSEIQQAEHRARIANSDPNNNQEVLSSSSRCSTATFSGFDEEPANPSSSSAASSASSNRTVRPTSAMKPSHPARSDLLEPMIYARENETSRCLLVSCKLMNKLEPKALQGYCLPVLASSERHKQLAVELRFDCVASMLGAPKCDLSAVIRLLEDIEKEASRQSGGVQELPQQQVAGPTSLATKRAHLLSARRAQTATDGRLTTVGAANANEAFLHILRGKMDKARSCLQVAAGGQQHRPQHQIARLVNLAYCLDKLDQPKESLKYLEETFALDPSNWTVHYNLLQVGRKLGYQLSELPQFARSIVQANNNNNQNRLQPLLVASNNQRPAKLRELLGHRLVLEPIQLALLYSQSGMSQSAWLIFNELLARSSSSSLSAAGARKPAVGSILSPELYLVLSKLAVAATTADSGSPQPDALNLLKQATGQHAYHVGLAERLVALQIDAFHYEEAERLLADCIRNQPGQVRWFQLLAECLRRQADYKRAMQVYRAAVDRFPWQSSACLRSLVKLARELGLMDEAAQYESRLNKTTNISNNNAAA